MLNPYQYLIISISAFVGLAALAVSLFLYFNEGLNSENRVYTGPIYAYQQLRNDPLCDVVVIVEPSQPYNYLESFKICDDNIFAVSQNFESLNFTTANGRFYTWNSITGEERLTEPEQTKGAVLLDIEKEYINAEISTAEWETYTNKKYGFMLKYPLNDGFAIAESPPGNGLYGGQSIVISKKSQAPNPPLNERSIIALEITVHDTERGETADKAYRRLNPIDDQLLDSLTQETINIANNQVNSYVGIPGYTGSTDGPLIHDNRLYIFSAVGPLSETLTAQILSTFEFVE